jgi:hypothetical protein
MPPTTESSVHSPEEIQKLNDVIDSTTLARLRSLLQDLSKKTPENFAYVRNELMLQPGALKRAWSEEREDEDESEDESEDSGQPESDFSDEQIEAPASRQRFEICEQCNIEYDVLLNDKKSCEWHDGKPRIRK